MTSFGWKRKVGEKVSKVASQTFEAAAEEDGVVDADVDWLHVTKRRRETLLEDCAVKSKRLKDEGVFLSENGRHWEAIGRWDEAIQLTPDCAALYEMKAQVLMILNEVFQAVQAAEMAVRLDPQWWEAWQTLGRAQLSLGEVALALRSFQRAVHTFPAESSLWEEDLGWAVELRRRQQQLSQASERRQAPAGDLPDYDFESDELVEACAAIAERDRQPLQTSSPVFVAAPGSGAEASLQARAFIQAR
ncbi:tetratricopeptide repeat protein 33 [Pristis pectinata]|uniref:tetratricopeptide repeat protein 33 n=1 Tax=Pristis pectinata TaxID=685728 RepID=UPI00223CF984|nr:tetratricopeptide repeat protein 33 [Pristis pectinata]XP_051876454.1 tetratricopeptide repeat protein 33 [Pristis pectinata]XP_051876455.1 tetratricopeptide repeat protein 33 [Pristis pectinata]XP_051876456.1 tetratricopeptide repeat protein 33 [Pristis pectinata]